MLFEITKTRQIHAYILIHDILQYTIFYTQKTKKLVLN